MSPRGALWRRGGRRREMPTQPSNSSAHGRPRRRLPTPPPGAPGPAAGFPSDPPDTVSTVSTEAEVEQEAVDGPDQPAVEPAVDREDLTEVPDDARTRHRDLSEELDRYAFAYYVQDAPLVSDGQYDELMGELKALEAAHPALVTPESPSQKVNGGFGATFAPVTHPERMQSPDTAFSSDELSAWAVRVEREVGTGVSYRCELKVDGVAVALLYEGGGLA